MADINFTLRDTPVTATQAGWTTNGHDVWDVLDADGEFIDSFTVAPQEDPYKAAIRWAEIHMCYA